MTLISGRGQAIKEHFEIFGDSCKSLRGSREEKMQNTVLHHETL